MRNFGFPGEINLAFVNKAGNKVVSRDTNILILMRSGHFLILIRVITLVLIISS